MSAHVAVIMGGWSAEREVSLVSGAAASKALASRGYRVTEIDADRDLSRRLVELKPDVVFNALHGRWGEDGCIQGILEVLEIPYTHSGVMASAVAMNKPMAKRVVAQAGVPVAEDKVVASADLFIADPLPRPYVVKPLDEGSSVGVVILKPGDNSFGPDVDGPWRQNDQVMVERYIAGRELTCAVIGDRATRGVTELRPKRGFYDYEAKYSDGVTEHVIPAPVPDTIYERVRALALAAHNALGCRGVSRSDFRYDDTEGGTGELILLEVNTQPGMTPLSLVPEMAAHEGMSFEDLVVWMVEDASCRR
ncbi:D-alanine--D-alanine ligase [Iodidimonas sp. SYSU 1G8]|uniref:D-alanine--D-alanine ligase n=1 Tax=Iodidimonas sp. SYSU 1G8 TaxID=3133967 RepID=UPI0031FE652F